MKISICDYRSMALIRMDVQRYIFIWFKWGFSFLYNKNWWKKSKHFLWISWLDKLFHVPGDATTSQSNSRILFRRCGYQWINNRTVHPNADIHEFHLFHSKRHHHSSCDCQKPSTASNVTYRWFFFPSQFLIKFNLFAVTIKKLRWTGSAHRIQR